MATQAEIEKRVHQVFEWMMEPQSREEMLRMGSEKWGVSGRQIEEYMGRAKKIIHAIVQKEKPYMLSEIIKKLETIYNKAMFQGYGKKTKIGTLVYQADMHVARQCLMDIAKLSGLVVDKIQPVDKTEFSDWDPKEIEEYAN